MKISKIPGLGRFGTFVDDVDFNHLSDEEWMEIGKLHLAGLVTILRNVKNFEADDLPVWMTKWGERRYSSNAFLEKKYNMPVGAIRKLAQSDPDKVDKVDRDSIEFGWRLSRPTKSGELIQRIQSGFDKDGFPNGLFAEGELDWHSNECGILPSVPGAALIGEAGMVGSATGFCTTVDYYESVSESFRSELNEMICVHKIDDHDVFGVKDKITLASLRVSACPHDYSEIPMVSDSPGGHRGLHYAYGTIVGIKDMSEKDARAVFDELDKNVFQEKYIYDHWYKQNNDLMLFDNSITSHRRLGSTEGRIAWRFAGDYTNLQDGFYQPYSLHPKYARAYIRELKQNIKLCGVKKFHMPTWVDYVKTFF
jgi:alpha-ketoglutarate-dependent taurine dioxygenase